MIKTRRTNGQPAYDQRDFQSCDARNMAFDDLMVIATFQSGLHGLEPVWQVQAMQAPSGFDYTTGLVGYGGQLSPIANGIMSPLVNQPQWAQTYLNEVAGTDTGFD